MYGRQIKRAEAEKSNNRNGFPADLVQKSNKGQNWTHWPDSIAEIVIRQ